MLRACCLLLCLVAGSFQSKLSISEFVVPKLVEAGSDVELQCNYELGSSSEKGVFLKWWWTPPDSTDGDKKQLYQVGPDHEPHFLQHKIDIDLKDNDTIVLKNVQPIASGLYECEVSEIDEDRKHEELVVYSKGSGPLLNVSEVDDGPDDDEEEDVFIECSSDDVAPLPNLEITINGETINATDVINGPDSMGFYDIFVNLTVSKSQVEGADIKCELFYAQSDVPHTPYIDEIKYTSSGAEVSTLEPSTILADDASPESLPHLPDGASRMQFSGLLLTTIAVTFSTLLIIPFNVILI